MSAVTASRLRRRGTLIVGLALVVAFLPVVAHGRGRVRAAGKPNILFILMDDMRSDGVMNNPAVLPKTKRWLGQAGTTFTNAFTTTSLCCPDRATIWSGRFEHNHGVVDNYSGDNLDRDWIEPRYLHDAGYTTALVGKFITDWNFRYTPPHFDAFAAFQGGYMNARFTVNGSGRRRRRTSTASPASVSRGSCRSRPTPRTRSRPRRGPTPATSTRCTRGRPATTPPPCRLGTRRRRSRWRGGPT